MKLKTIDARAAKTNVTLYNKQQELKDQEEKVRRIQKVFDMIEADSKKGRSVTGIKVSAFGSENLEYVMNLLTQLGYKVTYVKDSSGVVQPYIEIQWL